MRGYALAFSGLLCACVEATPAPGADSGSTGASGDTGAPEDEPIRVTHAFEPLTLGAFEDDATRCVSWTLNNEAPLYAQAVIASNEGSFHHSNWFVVTEDTYEGPDGYWPCDDRDYGEVQSASAGTVLFAQSTQSFTEEQRLVPGAVVKIPAHSKIVAGLHTLNASPRETSSGLWLTLELIHPSEVTAVVTPLAVQYEDLLIPAEQESRFLADCDFSGPYASATGGPLDLRLHYILPHYHYLGNYFDVTVSGGPLDGMSVFRLDGFNGEANGKTFDPPLHLPGATGLKVTCGYDNWRSDDVEWGNGDGEMCVLMALVEADAMLGGLVASGTQIVDVQDDIHMYSGNCLGLAVAKRPDQGMPTEQEKQAPLYLPPIDPEDADLPAVPECVDADPGATPEEPATLSSIRDTIFTPMCTFSSCHGAGGAAGLDLLRADLHAALLQHQVLTGDKPLVTPGNPDESWLYSVLSRCEPALDDGTVVAHMPRNAPTLIDDALVAKVRAWIERGALDD